MIRRPRRTAVAILAVSCVSWPALADEAAENYLKSWVEAIDASPAWSASYRSLDSDDSVTTMKGLTIASEEPGFQVTLDNFIVDGFSQSSDGALTASMLRLSGGQVKASDMLRVDLDSAEYTDVSFPTAEGFVWDESKPVVSVIKAASLINKVAMRSGRVSSIVIREHFEDVENTTTYEQVNIDNWAAGKIEAISAGPIYSESPAKEPLTAMSIASSTTRDVDLNAFFHVLDPDNYGADGAGDMQWRTMIGSVFYRDFIMAMPGVTMNIAEISADGMKLRQPAKGVGILAEIGPDSGDMFKDNPRKAFELLGLFTAYGLDKFEMRDMEVVAPNVETLTLGSFSARNMSSDNLGEFAFDRLAIDTDEQGALTLRRFAFGDIVPPSLDAIAAAIEATDKGNEVDYASIVSTLGFIEIAGLDAEPEDVPGAKIESLRVDLKDYLGPLPTHISWDLVNLDMDAEQISDPFLEDLIDRLEYDRIVVSSSMDAKWNEDGVIDIGQFRLAMKDVGAIYGDMRLAGILPSEALKIAEDPSIAEKLQFVRGSINLKDDSILGRGLTMQAEELGVDPEEFRNQLVSGLPFMLAFLGDTNLQAQAGPVIQQFLNTTGGTISVLASPASPIPFSAFEEAMEGGAPLGLLRTLNLSFTGLAGVTRKLEVKQTEEAVEEFWEEDAAEDEEPSDITEEPATEDDTAEPEATIPEDGKPAAAE